VGQQLEVEEAAGQALGQLGVGEARALQDLAGVEPRVATGIQHVAQRQLGQRLPGVLHTGKGGLVGRVERASDLQRHLGWKCPTCSTVLS
jgi:hypothetical protein